MDRHTQHSLTEEDIKHRKINPALQQSGWAFDQICMEHKITDGQIMTQGNKSARQAQKRADYVLTERPNYPIAVIEAKDNKHSPGHGLQQAMEYARMLDVKFAYSSNGDCFIEHDFITGKERRVELDEFPSLEQLQTRRNAVKPEAPAAQEPYYSGVTGQEKREPRYYQALAINKTVQAVADGQQRILLAMATGTGKTYTAFQIVWRLLHSGLKHKVLYLADRNILVDQSIQQDFSPLKKQVNKVERMRESDPAVLSAYSVHFALYQQLVGDGGEQHFRSLFKPDFFDLVIVDECHRGSAAKDSAWREILNYFSAATHLGMTATPKETKYVSNSDYFGKPLYEYSLRQGIEDGFLAPFKVINVQTNISKSWRPCAGTRDLNGNLVEDREYNTRDYDRHIILTDRTRAVAQRITDFLKATDRYAKTIVFCETVEAADRMRQELVNLNSDMVQQDPDYVVRITGDDEYGKGKLGYFISPTQPSPVIATTSKLLSTGVDCKTVKLIVLDQTIGSMTEFKQIIGRGTRIREDAGKLNFIIMDFRGVSALFADPDWDGPIEQHEDFDPNSNTDSGGDGNEDGDGKDDGDDDTTGPTEPRYKAIVGPDGCRVHITLEEVSFYDAQGKLLRRENIIDYTRTNIREQYATLEQFLHDWTGSDRQRLITDMLQEKGIDLQALKDERHMSDVDDFDFICHMAFDAKPLTRRERAENVKKRDFLNRYSGTAREVLDALIEQYARHGIGDLSDLSLLRNNPFNTFGNVSAILSMFGGRDVYENTVKELTAAIYQTAE